MKKYNISDFFQTVNAIKEYRDKNGIAWKVAAEKNESMITVQIGDNASVSFDKLLRADNRSHVFGQDLPTIWNKKNAQFQEAQEQAKRITDIRQIVLADNPDWRKAVLLNGFVGSKVMLTFSESVMTNYSRKPSFDHKAYLFGNQFRISYSKLGRTGYNIDSLADKLLSITKI